MLRRVILLGIICSVLLLPVAALADSISPSSFSAALDVGESVTITKTVTIDKGTPTSALVDVLFLTDTTLSMVNLIHTVQSNATTILTNAAGLGDVNFGVARYEDFDTSPYGYSGNVPFALMQDMTGDTDDVQDAINSLTAFGGNDIPESNLYALVQSADQVSWRNDSSRIIVWFGDARGHDGDLEPAYRDDTGLNDAISALNAKNITVQAIDMKSTDGLDGTGQATAITDATGGAVFQGQDLDADKIVDQIQKAIEATFQEYSAVELAAVGNLPGVDVVIAPADHTGDFDRSTARSFDFEVTFTGLSEGRHDFEIRALVDGGLVAIEKDSISVGNAPVPEPGTIILLSTGLIGLAGGMRKRLKKK